MVQQVSLLPWIKCLANTNLETLIWMGQLVFRLYTSYDDICLRSCGRTDSFLESKRRVLKGGVEGGRSCAAESNGASRTVFRYIEAARIATAETGVLINRSEQ